MRPGQGPASVASYDEPPLLGIPSAGTYSTNCAHSYAGACVQYSVSVSYRADRSWGGSVGGENAGGDTDAHRTA